MAAFNNNFDEKQPLGTDLAKDIDTFISADTRAAMNERLATEHYNLASDAVNPAGGETTTGAQQGRHIPGRVGVFGLGTWEERNGNTVLAPYEPGVGALWEITNTDNSTGNNYPAGTLFRYDETDGWLPTQLATGVIYATDEEVDSGTVGDKAINPAQLKADLQTMRIRRETTAAGDVIATEVLRTFDTVTNTIVDATHASPYVTLPAGVYKLRGTMCVGAQSASNAGRCTTMFYLINIDVGNQQVGVTSSTITFGQENSAGGQGGGLMPYESQITLTEPTTQLAFKQYYTQVNLSSINEGFSMGGGHTNVYMDIIIERVRD